MGGRNGRRTGKMAAEMADVPEKGAEEGV